MVEKSAQLQHSGLTRLTNCLLLSPAYMFNMGCRPNLLAIIAAQKAQKLQGQACVFKGSSDSLVQAARHSVN